MKRNYVLGTQDNTKDVLVIPLLTNKVKSSSPCKQNPSIKSFFCIFADNIAPIWALSIAYPPILQAHHYQMIRAWRRYYSYTDSSPRAAVRWREPWKRRLKGRISRWPRFRSHHSARMWSWDFKTIRRYTRNSNTAFLLFCLYSLRWWRICTWINNKINN